MNAEIKAQLLSVGSADIDEALLRQATRTTVPSSGPGAGLESFFLKSGGHRVRLAINSHSPLKIAGDGQKVAVIRDGVELVQARLEPALCHCPEQAYLTISGRCIYNCKFCPVPRLQGKVKSQERILRLVEEAERTGNLRAIALTSGVERSPADEVRAAVQMVKALRERYDLPIGVSVYPSKTSSEDLYAAGATEIKYNVQTLSFPLFKKCCPDLSLPLILESLEKAVEIFGRNRVTTNFIIGLGESDECVKSGASRLADMGVIPILRPISPHPLRKGEIQVQRPSTERLLRLGRMLKNVLNERGLCAHRAESMCLACTGCDLTPESGHLRSERDDNSLAGWQQKRDGSGECPHPRHPS